MADPGFPRGVRPRGGEGGCVNLDFAKFLAKMRENERICVNLLFAKVFAENA